MATERFICCTCERGFKRKQNLHVHLKTHGITIGLKRTSSEETRRKVYICPVPTCVYHHPSRALGDITGLKKHFSRKHAEKNLPCQKCPKVFSLKSDLKEHLKTCGTKEYQCDNCGTISQRKDKFNTHKRHCVALNRAKIFANTVTHQAQPPPPSQHMFQRQVSQPSLAQHLFHRQEPPPPPVNHSFHSQANHTFQHQAPSLPPSHQAPPPPLVQHLDHRTVPPPISFVPLLQHHNPNPIWDPPTSNPNPNPIWNPSTTNPTISNIPFRQNAASVGSYDVGSSMQRSHLSTSYNENIFTRDEFGHALNFTGMDEVFAFAAHPNW